MRTMPTEHHPSMQKACPTTGKKQRANQTSESSLLSNFMLQANQVNQNTPEVSAENPTTATVGDAGTPMEILKRFKMQKRVSMKQ